MDILGVILNSLEVEEKDTINIGVGGLLVKGGNGTRVTVGDDSLEVNVWDREIYLSGNLGDDSVSITGSDNLSVSGRGVYARVVLAPEPEAPDDDSFDIDFDDDEPAALPTVAPTATRAGEPGNN